MVQVKRVYDPPSPADGRRVLVDRIWPRGLTKEHAALDRWLKDLAPSHALRKWFAHELSRWEGFKERYHRELALKTDVIEELKLQAQGQTVTLLFSARDDQHNNAVALQEYLRA
jgi:uncharacterized protein YeaO (DUF488 family)